MSTFPHDIPDLYLAPTVLAIDARIQELAGMNLEQLRMNVALATNKVDFTREQRERGLLEAVRYLIDCHGWKLSWDPRGIRVAHGDREVVLGVPATFEQYRAGAATVDRRVSIP